MVLVVDIIIPVLLVIGLHMLSYRIDPPARIARQPLSRCQRWGYIGATGWIFASVAVDLLLLIPSDLVVWLIVIGCGWQIFWLWIAADDDGPDHDHERGPVPIDWQQFDHDRQHWHRQLI
jgi:hypothetical protein